MKIAVRDSGSLAPDATATTFIQLATSISNIATTIPTSPAPTTPPRVGFSPRTSHNTTLPFILVLIVLFGTAMLIWTYKGCVRGADKTETAQNATKVMMENGELELADDRSIESPASAVIKDGKSWGSKWTNFGQERDDLRHSAPADESLVTRSRRCTLFRRLMFK